VQPGDLLFFDALDRGQVTHVALYLGQGQVLHVAPATGVTKVDMARPALQRALVTARRLVKG
jgi:cell wall-associated NlpC family hydrolase